MVPYFSLYFSQRPSIPADLWNVGRERQIGQSFLLSLSILEWVLETPCNPKTPSKSKQNRKSPRKLCPPDWRSSKGAAGTASGAGSVPAPGCPQGLSRTSHTPHSTSTTLAGDISKIQTGTPSLPPGGSRLLHLSQGILPHPISLHLALGDNPVPEFPYHPSSLRREQGPKSPPQPPSPTPVQQESQQHQKRNLTRHHWKGSGTKLSVEPQPTSLSQDHTLYPIRATDY